LLAVASSEPFGVHLYEYYLLPRCVCVAEFPYAWNIPNHPSIPMRIYKTPETGLAHVLWTY
jgi:hypothetical protein